MTALLMAQDQTLSGQSSYRASVQKSFALMDAMQNGLMANLASLCDSLSKGTKSAADLIGNNSGNLSKRTKDALDDFDTVMTRTENLLTKTGELLQSLEAIVHQKVPFISCRQIFLFINDHIPAACLQRF